MRTSLSVLAATSILVFAACGDDNNEATNQQPSEQQQTKAKPVANITIGETEIRLTPSTVNVDKSGLIKINAKNNGSTVHALTIDAPQGEVETSDIQPGQSTSIEVNLKPGRYTIFCPVDNHREQGMRGTLVVAGGGGGGSDSSTSTPSQNQDDRGGGKGGDDRGRDGGEDSGQGGSNGSSGSGDGGSSY
jgi:uncharacterized cupredoxin-like copper-binding protein